jgi:hypothetical protein
MSDTSNEIATRPEQRALRSNRREVALGVAFTIVLVAARVVAYYHAGALWRDEVHVVNIASGPAFVEEVKNDWYPALFLATLRAWFILGFGGSDASIRAYGLLCGLLHVAAAWWTGRQFGARVPWALLVLWAFNPTLIVYGDAIRPHGLGFLTQLIMVGCIWRLAERLSWPRGAAALIAALLAVQAGYVNAPMLLAASVGGGLVALRRRDIRTILAILVVGLISAVSVVPYVLNALRPANHWMHVVRREWPWSHHLALFRDCIATGGAAMQLVWLAATLSSLVVALVAIRQWRRASDGPDYVDQGLFLLGHVVVGTIGFWCYIRFTGVPTQVWYYLPLVTLLSLTVEFALRIAVALKPRMQAVLPIAAVATAACAFPATWPSLEFRFTNVDLIAQTLAGEATHDDLVVVFPWYAGLTFGRYDRGTAPSMNFPDVEKNRQTHHGYEEMKQRMEQTEPIGQELGRFERTLRRGGRIWVVGGLQFLPRGAVPLELSPAPDPVYGWNLAAYETSWSQQAAWFLQTHAKSVRLVGVEASAARVNPYENLPLFVAQGWHDESDSR